MQFNRAIPGQSLTTPPKSAPYERPPQISDPLEALDYHIEKLDDPKAVEELMFFLEMGVDLVSLVEGVARNAVFEGIHSIDISLIISPVIHEYIKGYADAMDIEYEEGFEDRDQDERISYARNQILARKVLSEMSSKDDSVRMPPQKDEPVEEEMPEINTPPEEPQEQTTAKPQGLMARM